MTITIAAIAGSLRRGSFNRMLLQPTARPPPAGAELEAFHLLDRVPPVNEDWAADPAPC
jgi:NAD(P)H-dependent FMN reductase